MKKNDYSSCKISKKNFLCTRMPHLFILFTEKLRHQTKLELEDNKSSQSHQQSRQCLSMKSMPDLLSGSSGNFFRNNSSGGPGASSGNGSCAGKSPSPPPDSLEDISYIDMEDDEMEEVLFACYYNPLLIRNRFPLKPNKS